MKKQFTRLIGACCVSVFLFLISATVGYSQSYCTVQSDTPGDDHLTNVTFAGIDNTSGSSTYTDYTNITGTVIPGQTYEFSGTVYNAGIWDENIVVYIDWDQSGTFDASERYEMGSCSDNNCTLTGDIEVPVTATPGQTRMRVLEKYGTTFSYAVDACTSYTFGEIEDYSIIVQSGVCTPPSLTYTVTNDCANDTYKLVVVIDSLGSSSSGTIFHKRSDGVSITNTALIPQLVGIPLTIASSIPFGVTVRDSIVSGNPMCTLMRNFHENVCPAENDEICDAISLTCGDTLSDMPFVGATQSLDDDCYGTGTVDVWYTFTSDGLEKYKFAEVSSMDIVMSVYKGTSCNDTVPYLPCQDGESLTITEAGTYFVHMRPYYVAGENGFHSVAIECIPFDCPTVLADVGGPCDDNDPNTVNDKIQEDCSCVGIPQIVNDEACTALLMNCGDTLLQHFEGSTMSIDDDCYGTPAGGDAWIKFIVDGTQIYTIAEGGGLYFDAIVQLFKGDDCGNLTEVEACKDSPESFEVYEAGTYYFRIRSYGTYSEENGATITLSCSEFDCPNLNLNIGYACDDQDPSTVNDVVTGDCECAGVPQAPNDEVCDATELVCNELLENQDLTGSTVSITDDCWMPENGDIWYKFTTTIGEAYSIDVEGDGPNSTALTTSLYMAADCDSLIELLPCNTFSIGYVFDEADTVATYYMRVRAYSNAESVNVRLQCGTPPDNGDCATAEAVSCGETYTGSTLAAPEIGTNLSFCGMPSYNQPDSDNGGVWYTYTPTDSTLATFDLSGSTFNTTMFLYSNTCDSLVCVANDYSSGEGNSSKIVQALSGGETYYVLISGYGNNRGAYTLNVTCQSECNGTPLAGTVSDMVVCTASDIELSATNVSDDVFSIEFNWQSSPAGENNWTDIAGGTTVPFILEDGVTEATDFRLKTTCVATGDSIFSNVLSATLNPNPLECYCTPIYSTGCTVGDLISNVSLTGESVSIDNDSECSEGNYTDYTDLPAPDLNPGESYTLSVSTTYGSPQYEDVKAWIDYNLNGAFEDNEEIANTYGDGLPNGTLGFNFNVAEGIDPGMYRMRVRMVYSNEDFTACSDQTYGETEDYMVEILQLPGCSAVDAGTASADVSLICPITPFNLSVTGATEPADGLTRIWQSSVDGGSTWTNITGANSTSYTSPGISEDTEFRYSVTCATNQATDVSNVVSVTVNTDVSACYCTPEGTNPNYYMDSFSTTGGVQNINNTASGYSTGGYGDFTSMVVSQEQTQSVSFLESFTTADFPGGTAGLRIWIDWNQDGYFDPVNEVAYQSTSYGTTQSGTITVPQTALAGPTRMRVMADYLSIAGGTDPCESFNYGEFEDYTFNVIPLDECTGSPSAGDADVDQFTICPNSPVTLSVDGASGPATGLTRNWQSSPAGANTWTNIDGAVDPTYILADGITVATDFRYAVTCANTNETDYSNIIEATINTNVTECYCIPTTANNTYYITSFTATGNGAQNISNTGTGSSLSGSGYSDYTNLPAVTGDAGGSVSFTGAVNSSSNAGFRIWVDWNQNGSFADAGEVVYSTSSYAYSFSGSFAVPANASGLYRVRIGSSYIPSTGPDSPCGQPDYGGEYEDYMLNVGELTIASLTGTISNWSSNCTEGNATVKLYTPGTANLVTSYDVTVGAGGTFTIDNVQLGTFDVIVKVSGYLAKGVQDVAIIGGANNVPLDAIAGGDTNNDNAITIADVSAFSSAFGSSTGQPGYNPMADLDCSGSVTLIDFTSMTQSYGTSGATAPLGN